MTYLIDGRPLQGPSAVRGIGSYARGLLAGFAEIGVIDRVRVLLDRGRDDPDELRALGVRAARTRVATAHRRIQPFVDPITIARAVRRERPDVYHAIEFGQPLVSSVPVVVTVHDLIPFVLPDAYPWAWRYRALVLHQLRRADRVIAVSKATAADVRRLARVPPHRITVVGEGVAPIFAQAPAEAIAQVRARFGLRRPFLLAVGTFDPRKRIDLLADVVQRVRRDHDVDLVVAGDQAVFLPRVEAELAARGVDAHTTILGHVSVDDLPALYSAADCLVFPSAYEGFGLPPLEAMACATPSVVFANSSLPEVAAMGALIVPDGDAAAMAVATARILGDPRERARLVEEGLRWVRRFTWRDAAERTLGVYQQAAA